MARMLGASHYWNARYCNWRENDYGSRRSWPKAVQKAFKRRQRRRERRESVDG
jgi:hypothetical protein